MKLSGVSEQNLKTSGAGKPGKLTGQNEDYVRKPTTGSGAGRGGKSDANSTTRGGGLGGGDNDSDD